MEKEILSRLDEIAILLAIIAKGDRPNIEVVNSLIQGGLTPKRISELLGVNQNTVKVAAFRHRKKKH